jgi:hypothetical protein
MLSAEIAGLTAIATKTAQAVAQSRNRLNRFMVTSFFKKLVCPTGCLKTSIKPSAKACGVLESAAYSAIGEHLQEPHNAGSQTQAQFFNSLSKPHGPGYRILGER